MVRFYQAKVVQNMMWVAEYFVRDHHQSVNIELRPCQSVIRVALPRSADCRMMRLPPPASVAPARLRVG